MQAQQSNTASGPGKTNTSFFASIRAAAAAQKQSIEDTSNSIAAPIKSASGAMDAANLTSPPQRLERNDETSLHGKTGGSLSLEDRNANQPSPGAAREERTAPTMLASARKTIRIDRMEDQPAARAVLSRLINSANTDRIRHNPNPADDPPQRRTPLDRYNFAIDSYRNHSMHSGIRTVEQDSFSQSETSAPHILARGPDTLVNAPTPTHSGQSTEGLQREQSTRAGLAHDAKSLLAALKLYSELLALPGVLSEQHRHYANDLKSLAERSWALVERLLPPEGTTDLGQPLAPEGTNLVETIADCRSLLTTLASGALEIRFGVHAAQPVPVSAEALERILVNLVNNATEATRERGSIRIKADLEAQLCPPSTHAMPQQSVTMVLSVDDSGCGMTEKQMEELSRERTALPGQRRGIGLQVVQDLVSASGGTLALHSRIGVGTRVEIRWPVAYGAVGGSAFREDGQPGTAVPGVIDCMEMIASSATSPEPDHLASKGDRMLQDERTPRWRNEKGVGASGAVEGWRGAIRNLGFASVSTRTNPSDQAKSAEPSNGSQGAIAC